MLIYIYIFFLAFWFFDSNYVFFNEEFLIGIVMLIVFYFLLSSFRKLVNSFFFFRAEFIYFSFLFLIKLNINLINKILNLISLADLRFDLSLLNNSNLVYSTFLNFFDNSISSFAIIALKKYIYTIFLNLYIVEFIAVSDNFDLEMYTTSDEVIINENFMINGLVELNLTRNYVEPIMISLIDFDTVDYTFPSKDLDFSDESTDSMFEPSCFDIVDCRFPSKDDDFIRIVDHRFCSKHLDFFEACTDSMCA